MNSKDVGNISELAVMAALAKMGKRILVPFGDNLRYDLLIDNQDGTFTRVQCKTARLKEDKGYIKFATCSSQYHRGGVKHDYYYEAELFGVYCPQLDKVYLISYIYFSYLFDTFLAFFEYFLR